MRSGRGWASGKLILVGEHAVVFGHPALAFAVDRGTTVELTRRDAPTVVDTPVMDPRIVDALRAVLGAEGSRQGWQVRVRSDLPVGRGMGSSASLAVALVRAWQDATGATDDVLEAAMAVERVFHGTPSGVDVAVACTGGVVRFRKTTPLTRTTLPAPAWQGVVIDTGKAGDTGHLVAGVASRRPGIDEHLDRIGALVDDATAILDDAAALGPLLDENHALLGRIGVSTPELDMLCALARAHGAHGAKLSGAGGGGVVLALADEPQPILDAAAARGYAAWPIRPAPGGDA